MSDNDDLSHYSGVGDNASERFSGIMGAGLGVVVGSTARSINDGARNVGEAMAPASGAIIDVLLHGKGLFANAWRVGAISSTLTGFLWVPYLIFGKVPTPGTNDVGFAIAATYFTGIAAAAGLAFGYIPGFPILAVGLATGHTATALYRFARDKIYKRYPNTQHEYISAARNIASVAANTTSDDPISYEGKYHLAHMPISHIKTRNGRELLARHVSKNLASFEGMAARLDQNGSHNLLLSFKNAGQEYTAAQKKVLRASLTASIGAAAVCVTPFVVMVGIDEVLDKTSSYQARLYHEADEPILKQVEQSRKELLSTIYQIDHRCPGAFTWQIDTLHNDKPVRHHLKKPEEIRGVYYLNTNTLSNFKITFLSRTFSGAQADLAYDRFKGSQENMVTKFTETYKDPLADIKSIIQTAKTVATASERNDLNREIESANTAWKNHRNLTISYIRGDKLPAPTR